MMGVKAKCKNCGNEAIADQFKLHNALRMMVCPSCYSGKGLKAKEVTENRVESKPQGPPKPAGWDKEDDYLERMVAIKKAKNQSYFSRIAGTDLVKCLCSSCKYNFRYNPIKKMPPACPYCNADIPRLKMSELE